MATNYVLIIAIVVLVACGTVLVLERSLTRILVGWVMLGNGVNITYLVASGPAGGAPIIGAGDDSQMTDPLPQAMVLTAIVITLGVTAFGLALAYRAWQLSGHDDVQDDVEDDLVRRRADLDHTSATFDDIEAGVPDEEGEDLPAPRTGVSDDELAAALAAEDAEELEAATRSQWVGPTDGAADPTDAADLEQSRDPDLEPDTGTTEDDR
ncbi:hypothetical protein N802_05280 [Knoellia sinensis KCTC 19936]|uniref:NADH-ubiquinone oxidoreductase subunit 4L n=1 Tax=Knoellia sinensis KCTC 19936 TaxID=1385520 RepID=A0A0A0J1S5_9MICO|nr:Na(+)/H(+) antiporter subunit C [Knoellia sinensis]KGN31018.1 hypothetical protein N802_05280 [Knoellia sinensis KCTC 19936]